MAFGQLRAPVLVVRSSTYAGSGSRVLTDAAGKRRNPPFRQRLRGFRSYRPNPYGESGSNRVLQHSRGSARKTLQSASKIDRMNRQSELNRGLMLNILI